MSASTKPTGTRTRVIGQALSRLIARYPGSWPLVAGSVRRFFDARANRWDERTGAGTVEHLAPLAVAVGHLEASPERILDLGCGTGEAALFLAREYPRASIRGIDISPAMIECARQKIGLDPEARIAFKVGDAAHLPFPDQSFDLICQVNVPLFHRELDRVLRPGGSVIIVSTSGASTPFHTPESVTMDKLEDSGMGLITRGEVGSGIFLLFGARDA